MSDSTVNTDLSTQSSNIPVAEFRQIHHLPLVWQGQDYDAFLRRLDSDTAWNEITEQNSLRLLASDRSKRDTDVFSEFVYFHDFVRDFLYPHGPVENRPFRLFEQSDPGGLTASFGNGGGTHAFKIERLTLHLFATKIAIVTVETTHIADDARPELTLAQVLTIIDQFRRSYIPYWNGETPGGVPQNVTLNGKEHTDTQSQLSSVEFLEGNRSTGADAPLLQPWASWVQPLTRQDWRDPSDERVPVMSLILLKKTTPTNRDTLKQINDGDWFRLAEADESGDAEYVYNFRHLDGLRSKVFYDRYLPDKGMAPYLATRHVFGGAHYSLVSVDDADAQFPFAPTLTSHFRRHYEKMALVARFEFASLLAFSSRITNLVKRLENEGADAGARRAFRAEMMRIHEEFLEFTHRYRFTGISSQIQASEMFVHWRDSLGLNDLYADVKEEITSASQYAQATLADERAGRANGLAAIAIFVGALLAAPGLNELSLVQILVEWICNNLALYGVFDAKPLVEFLLPVVLVSGVSWGLWAWFKWRSARK
jgi:hypothetical protein